MLEKKYNQRIYFLWTISAMCILVGVVTTSLLSIIPLIIFLYVLFFQSIDTAMVLLFVLMPFANVFKLSPNSTSLFTVCELILVVWLALKKGVKTSFFCTVFVIAAYYCVFSVQNLQIFTILKAVILFFLVYDYCRGVNKEDVVLISRLLAISVIVMLLLSINGNYSSSVVPYLNDLDYVIDINGHATTTIRNSGFLGDPNYCAALILMTQALLCVLYYYKSMGNEFWVYTGFLIPLGLYTYSKSYILCISVLCVMLFIFVLLPKHRVWAAVALAAMIAVIYLIMQGKIPLVQTILERFTHGSILTGRSQLNDEYLAYILGDVRRLFFGSGITADRFYGAGNNVHNIYIEVLFKLGIIGTILYIITLLSAFGVRYIHKDIVHLPMINWLPLMFFGVVFAFLAGVTNYALPFYYCIVYFGLQYCKLPSANCFPESEDDMAH